MAIAIKRFGAIAKSGAVWQAPFDRWQIFFRFPTAAGEIYGLILKTRACSAIRNHAQSFHNF
jgi:hypothetical protein